jgi:hypothetical protein
MCTISSRKKYVILSFLVYLKRWLVAQATDMSCSRMISEKGRGPM